MPYELASKTGDSPASGEAPVPRDVVGKPLTPRARSGRIQTALVSLHLRLTAWNTVVVLLAALLSLAAVRTGVRVALVREADTYLLDEALEVSLAVSQLYPDLDRLREEMDRKATGHQDRRLFVQLLDKSGKVVCASTGAPDVIGRLAMPKARTSLSTVDGMRVVVRAMKGRSPGGLVCVGASLDAVEADLARLTRTLISVGALTVLLAPLGGYWLAGRATRPLARINHVAAALRPSKLDERLPVRGTGDELDRLSQTINGLLDRIADYLDRNRQFVASAAHELRSPLAAIQSSVEVALNTDRTAAEYQELLAEIAEEAGELRLLVNQLLLLAEGDTGTPGEGFEPVELDRVVSRAVDMFRDAADEQGVRLRLEKLERLRVRGHEGRLRQVINNLIDNALKFNRPGGRVDVELCRDLEQGGILLRVTDTGPGISREDLPHIFERFYRGDKSRHRDAGHCGNGLGLSICQAIVTAHGGTITVESQPALGTTFRVRLPAEFERQGAKISLH